MTSVPLRFAAPPSLAGSVCSLLFVVSGWPAIAYAQPAAPEPDKTGTNPLVLRYTIQPVNEYYVLADGDDHNILKLKFAVPFGGSRANVNLTVPISTSNTGHAALPGGSDGPITAPPPLGAAPAGTTTGLGDIALKTSYIPYFNPRRKFGLLLAVELGFTTATETVMGTGKNTLMPSLTAVMFPARYTIFAPVYKQTNSYSGDRTRGDLNQGAIDLYLVRMFNGGKTYLNLDPQLIFDYENHTFSALLETTVGVSLSKEKGLTLTVTPGIPISGTKPYDFLFKAGIKKVF